MCVCVCVCVFVFFYFSIVTFLSLCCDLSPSLPFSVLDTKIGGFCSLVAVMLDYLS